MWGVVDQLSVRFDEDPDGVWGDAVIFVINGRSLVDLATRPGDGWIGPPLRVVQGHPDHLRGGPDRWEEEDGSWYSDPALLACGCGQPGCEALLVHIELDEATVRWSQIRRGSADWFTPTEIGPFVFGRSEYERVLDKIATRQRPAS